jgi:membrane protein implicated in regulation of membrane protease activity
MVLWQLLAVCGIAFLILEVFTPSMFFLNFALASFITAVLSFYTTSVYTLVIAFFVFSFVSFVFLRPVIMKKITKTNETGINSKYIDKIAKAESEINSSSGVISIYGERWEARSENIPLFHKVAKLKLFATIV